MVIYIGIGTVPAFLIVYIVCVCVNLFFEQNRLNNLCFAFLKDISRKKSHKSNLLCLNDLLEVMYANEPTCL